MRIINLRSVSSLVMTQLQGFSHYYQEVQLKEKLFRFKEVRCIRGQMRRDAVDVLWELRWQSIPVLPKFGYYLLRGANNIPPAVITGKTGLWVQKGVWDILMGMLVTLYF